MTRSAIDPGYVLDGYTLVHGDRNADYGHPHEDFQRIADMWSAILGFEISRDQYIQCMIAVKLSRLSNNPDHDDSWTDIVGYVACRDRIKRIKNATEDTGAPEEVTEVSWENLNDAWGVMTEAAGMGPMDRRDPRGIL